jgi:hypothetical protein
MEKKVQHNSGTSAVLRANTKIPRRMIHKHPLHPVLPTSIKKLNALSLATFQRKLASRHFA